MKPPAQIKDDDGFEIMKLMLTIFIGIITTLGLQYWTLRPNTDSKISWIAPVENPEKRNYEVFALLYTPFWISCFAIIVGFELYEMFDEMIYMIVCGGLCIPLLLYPFFANNGTGKPLSDHYAMKANVWLAIYSFIGNYWYTHYFYSVLKASYTFPSWRLNNVPIPLYFATFFYFSTYHVFSNMTIRKVVTSFCPSKARTLFLITMILAMSYFTAFAEAIAISGFRYYSFENRKTAYSIGSAFYGIYFLVSFPMFYRLNEEPSIKMTLWQCCIDSLGCGMLIMLLLDFVRLVVGIPLVIGSS